jgi:hypothetical protein
MQSLGADEVFSFLPEADGVAHRQSQDFGGHLREREREREKLKKRDKQVRWNSSFDVGVLQHENERVW